MDCEKFESLLIDELYGELDEVTSAAVRRHAAGCARCGALLSGLRATRKVAALPVEEPSSDLEDRILSAVREQQKVLPFRARAATALSRAGAWAMRPQTAMAAVFLVVIGTSFVLVQSKKSATSSAAAQMDFNGEGAPVRAAANAPYPTTAASAYAFDQKESAFAHGIEEKRLEQQRPTATTALAATEPLADNEKDKARDESPGHAGPLAKNDLPTNAGAIAGAQGRAGDLDIAGGYRGGGGGSTGNSTAPPPMVQSQAPYGGGGVSFGSAKQAYDQGRWDDARTQFDSLAASDANAQLWAARSERQKSGCTAAVAARFDQVTARAPNTTAGNDALLDAARCYRAMGNTPIARARYSTLLSNPGYRVTAQSELDAMSPAVAHKAESRAMSPAATTTSAHTTPQATQPAQKAADANGL